MAVYASCVIPEDIYFDIERDVWIRFDENGVATLGMTDPAQTRCGKLINVRFKKVGKIVEQGKNAATIESAKWVGPFPMPFDGEVLEVNSAGYSEDILLLNKDPYDTGWLVKVRPTNLEAQYDHLLKGDAAVEAYQKRIDFLGVNCLRCLD
jgi:glycine cleavage system H protein